MDYTQEINKIKRELTEISLQNKNIQSLEAARSGAISILLRVVVMYVSVAALLYFSDVSGYIWKAGIIPVGYVVYTLISILLRKIL